LAGTDPASEFGGACQFAEADEGDGENGCLRLAGEEADSGAEGMDLAVAAAGALWEDEDGVFAVHGLAGVGEAALEALAAGEREDVEERGDEQVCGGGEQIEHGVALVAGMAVVEEHFAGHGNGDASAEGAGERVEDERAVVGGDVVGDDEEWAGGQGSGRALDARRAEEPDQGTHDEFDEDDAQGGDGPGPGPAGVGVFVPGF